MFNSRPYYLVNREERHFGFLFASALIYNHSFRTEIFKRYETIAQTHLDPKAGQFDIYLEVAALRDFWNDLYPKNNNNKPVYTPEAEDQKRKILTCLFDFLLPNLDILDKYKVFWTGNEPQRGKLWSPGQWDVGQLRIVEDEESLERDTLVQIRWAFNAKPDILIASKESSLMVEVKLESAEGTTDTGYSQFPIQELIAKLMHLLIPEFQSHPIKNSCLTLSGNLDSKNKNVQGLSWAEVIETLEKTHNNEEGSLYIIKCLQPLKRYF